MDQTLFRDIAKHFKAVFLDSYGVLKNYKGMITGAQETLDFLRDEGIEFIVLTNDASRSQLQQAEAFERIGLRGIEMENIITSGMLAQQFLKQKITRGKIAFLGTENAAHYILNSGLEHIMVRDVDLEDMEAISGFAFLDDEGFDWNTDINKAINLLNRKNIPVVVANSDKLYPVSKNDVSLATGGIAKLMEMILNKKFIHFGKPDSQMFMYAFDHINQRGQFNKNDILMVGDNLNTDILGGNKFGLKTALVLTGNTRPELVDMMVSSTGIIPDYICRSIGA